MMPPDQTLSRYGRYRDTSFISQTPLDSSPSQGKPPPMRMHVSADISLSEPSIDCGLITWFRIEIFDDNEGNAELVGRVRVARIHASHAADAGESLWETIFAGSGELEAIYEVFYHDERLEAKFADESGADVLYVSEIDIDAAYEHRNIDLAVVRRLCDKLGQGAALTVVPYASSLEIAHWQQLGFQVATPNSDEGYLYLRLTNRTARVNDPDKHGHFKVFSNPSPEQDETHH